MLISKGVIEELVLSGKNPMQMFGTEILELACGFGADIGCGFNPIPTATHLVDKNHQIEMWKGQKEIHVRDIELGFDDWPTAHFDFTFSRNVVELLKDPSAFLNTCFRVTKPGGCVIVGTWAHEPILRILHANEVPCRIIGDVSGTYLVIDVWQHADNNPISKAPAPLDRYRKYSEASPWPTIISPPRLPTYRRLSLVIDVPKPTAYFLNVLGDLLRLIPDAEIIVDQNSLFHYRSGIVLNEVGDCIKSLKRHNARSTVKFWNDAIHSSSGDLLGVIDSNTAADAAEILELIAGAWEIGISSQDSVTLDNEFEVLEICQSAHGASCPCSGVLFFRLDVWQSVGAFEEECLDTDASVIDWGLRARLKGYGWATGLEHPCDTKSALSQGKYDSYLECSQKLELMRRFGGKGLGEKIVIRRWGAVGDVIMATLPIRALRVRKPLAHIQLVTEPIIRSFLENLDIVDSVSCDSAEDATRHVNLDDAYEEALRSEVWLHPVFAYAGRLGVNVPLESYTVPNPSSLQAWARAMLDFDPNASYVALCLRSATRSMANWSEDKWIDLCRLCPETVFVLLDPDPHPCVDVWGNHHSASRLWDEPNIVDLTGKTPSLAHAAAVIMECKACVSVDTGTAHIASALSIPVVMLFGGAAGWARAPITGLFRAIQGSAPCYPCKNLGGCPRNDGAHCLEPVTATQVRNNLMEILK